MLVSNSLVKFVVVGALFSVGRIASSAPLGSHREAALLRLTHCLLRIYGFTVDTEILEQFVQHRDISSLVQGRFCDTSLHACLPSSSLKKKTDSDRYLSSLIIDAHNLCSNRTDSVRNIPPKKENTYPIPSEGVSPHIIVLYAIFILNSAGILTGFAYSYKSNCTSYNYHVPGGVTNSSDETG